ncbi:hypothetical protein [Streptomyces sp. NPDC004675]|uniref:hypothetical protein n=1 Tax=Streptomyces sp. NPDC004675 TaxID=3154286 RepID=UPI0033A55FD8
MQESDEPSPADGPLYERLVGRALDLPRVAHAIDAGGAGPSRAALRARALQACDRLAAAAPEEYARYLTLRAAALARGGRGPDADGRSRGGLLPVLAVLVPSLGAAATGVFLLCGFGLRAFAVRPHIGDGLVMAGVIAAAVTAGAALGDLAWILATRSRGRRGRGGGGRADGDPEVCAARADWEHAVLERGVVPFLLGQLDPGNADHRRAGSDRVEARHADGRPGERERAVGAEERAQ